MARKGPITTDTSTLALGLAQVRVGDSSTNITEIQPALASSDSIGSLASTKYTGNVDWFRHESGFPLLEDYTIPIRETAMLEGEIEELTPANLALIHGHDPNAAPYSSMTVHSGEIPLGGRDAPDYVRMEAQYTFPNGTNHMYIIFPRAQVAATAEIDLAKEDNAKVPVMFESKDSSSDVSGGNAVWDDKPLGRIFFD